MQLNPATVLLARHVRVGAGDAVVHLNCGGGELGVAAAGAGARRVILACRSVVHAEAAARTMMGAGIADPEVRLSHGTVDLPGDFAEESSADVVAIRVPRDRPSLHQLLWDAFRLLKDGGRCYISGANREGARPAVRAMQELFGNAEVIAHGSGHRIASATRQTQAPVSVELIAQSFLGHEDFREIPAAIGGHELVLFTRPGVFSWDHVDEATEILAATMHVEEGESVLDLGCGAGSLGTVAALMSGSGRTCMVDADIEAVRCARRTAAHAGATRIDVMPSDVATAVLDQRFDVVVTNPPFHEGRSTDLALPRRFIDHAYTVLKPGGRLYLVANRTLPYERDMRERFGSITTPHDGPRFKVIAAVRQST